MRRSPSSHPLAVGVRPSPIILGISIALVVVGWANLRVSVAWAHTHDFVDFGVFYDSARCILEDCPRYVQPVWTGANLNPPFSQWFFLPFTLFEPPSAFLIWTVLWVACLAWALLLVHHNQHLSANVWCVLLTGLVASQVFQFQVVTVGGAAQ